MTVTGETVLGFTSLACMLSVPQICFSVKPLAQTLFFCGCDNDEWVRHGQSSEYRTRNSSCVQRIYHLLRFYVCLAFKRLKNYECKKPGKRRIYSFILCDGNRRWRSWVPFLFLIRCCLLCVMALGSSDQIFFPSVASFFFFFSSYEFSSDSQILYLPSSDDMSRELWLSSP